jgi:thiol-disulfide isomerase/thioredoxin
MDPQQPEPPDTESRTDDVQPDLSQQSYDRFVDGQTELDQQLGGTVEPPPFDSAQGKQPSRKSAWLAMGAVAVALGLLWLAPGVGDQDSAQEPSASAVPESEGGEDAGALTKGSPAPLQFTMKDMNGVDVKLASFKGKVILLNFWATWCGPCRAEIPSLVELQQHYGDDLVVLGVSIDDPLNKLKPYATDMHMNYPVLVGKDRQDVQDAYGPLWGIPVSVFVDREGKIWKRHSGIASKDQFEREIKALL